MVLYYLTIGCVKTFLGDVVLEHIHSESGYCNVMPHRLKMLVQFLALTVVLTELLLKSILLQIVAINCGTFPIK